MPKIDHSSASLRFIGEGLDPNELLNRLEFHPSEDATKPIVKTRGENIVVLSVGYRESGSRDLGIKIEAILSWFTRDLTVWKELSKQYRGEIFCGLFLNGWNRGFELSAELLMNISERNLLIGFDIYSPTDTWDECR